MRTRFSDNNSKKKRDMIKSKTVFWKIQEILQIIDIESWSHLGTGGQNSKGEQLGSEPTQVPA